MFHTDLILEIVHELRIEHKSEEIVCDCSNIDNFPSHRVNRNLTLVIGILFKLTEAKRAFEIQMNKDIRQ